MDAHPVPALYRVALRGAPEVFSARRQQLEAALMQRLDDAYGGHAAAAGALHAHANAVELEPGEMTWDEALTVAAASLSAELLPGARFECELISQPVHRVP